MERLQRATLRHVANICILGTQCHNHPRWQPARIQVNCCRQPSPVATATSGVNAQYVCGEIHIVRLKAAVTPQQTFSHRRSAALWLTRGHMHESHAPAPPTVGVPATVCGRTSGTATCAKRRSCGAANMVPPRTPVGFAPGASSRCSRRGRGPLWESTTFCASVTASATIFTSTPSGSARAENSDTCTHGEHAW